MTHKRGNGQGSIDTRGENTHRLRYQINGKRHIVTFKGSKTDAHRELRRLLKSADDGTHIDHSKATVSAFFERWERDWAANNVSPKTFERYQGIIAKQIKTHIGHLAIQKLRAVDLNELYAKLLRQDKLSPRTVGHVHRVLHRALGHAAAWHVVQQNVASLVRPPRVAATEIEIIREGEIRTVLQKLRGRAMYPIAALALATGLRRGELLGLRRQDLDLDAGKIRVEQSLEQTKAGLRFKSPKTKHGRRTIAINASAAAELRAHLNRQNETRLAIGQGRAPADALVFPTWDGKPRSPNALTKEWSMAMAEAGIAVTFHALRHTHASSLIAAGLDVLTISRRLGHASPTITLGVYGHLFANTDDRAAEVMEALFLKVCTE
jgi:integrase